MSGFITPSGRLAAALSLLAVLSGTAHSAVVHDESLHGDLNDAMEVPPWLSPGSHLGTFAVGTHVVHGSFGRPPGGSLDSDVMTWIVAPGMKLDAIHIDYTVLEGDNGNGSYFAIAGGSMVGSGMGSAAGNLSDTLVPGSGELLAAWSNGPYVFGTGLSAPLPAGTYTLMAHEIGAKVGYTLSFQVSAVPEPHTSALLLAGLGLTGWTARRRRARSGDAS